MAIESKSFDFAIVRIKYDCLQSSEKGGGAIHPVNKWHYGFLGHGVDFVRQIPPIGAIICIMVSLFPIGIQEESGG